MKILITAQGKTMEDKFDLKFGRCDFFQIVDTETDKVEVIENEGKKSGHGAGTAASQQAIDAKVDVLITGHLGPNSFQVLDSSDIELLAAKGGTVGEVLEQYKSGKLEKIASAGQSHKGM